MHLLRRRSQKYPDLDVISLLDLFPPKGNTERESFVRLLVRMLSYFVPDDGLTVSLLSMSDLLLMMRHIAVHRKVPP